MNTEKTTIVVVEVETAPEYLTAKQARELAAIERRKEVDKIFPEVLDWIRQKATEGNLSCVYKRSLTFGGDTRPGVARKLESLGYKVSTDFCGGYSVWTINW